MDDAKLDGLRERIATDPACTACDNQIQAEAQKPLTAPLPQHVLRAWGPSRPGPAVEGTGGLM